MSWMQYHQSGYLLTDKYDECILLLINGKLETLIHYIFCFFAFSFNFQMLFNFHLLLLFPNLIKLFQSSMAYSKTFHLFSILIYVYYLISVSWLVIVLPKILLCPNYWRSKHALFLGKLNFLKVVFKFVNLCFDRVFKQIQKGFFPAWEYWTMYLIMWIFFCYVLVCNLHPNFQSKDI